MFVDADDFQSWLGDINSEFQQVRGLQQAASAEKVRLLNEFVEFCWMQYRAALDDTYEGKHCEPEGT